ncbi:4-hydroxyphenylpyruvate dioxygenase-like protein isoform X1 [Ciona intestinalis]
MYHTIHHIRYSVKNVEKFSSFLINQLKFKKYATPKASKCPLRSKSTVLRHADVIFIIDELKEGTEPCCGNFFCHRNNNHPVNTACDVCFQTSQVDFILQRGKSVSSENIHRETDHIGDKDGIVSYAIIKSPVGNLQHTLIDLTKYGGAFLPGFEVDQAWNAEENPQFMTAVDHIAFALKLEHTDEVVQWYNHCLGFSRMIINIEEDFDDGFVVKEGTRGLRLKAVLGPQHLEELKLQNKVPKFVLCEALQLDKKSLMEQFFSMHQGEGVQHIAFSTNNIVDAISHYKASGLQCVLPPDAYYIENFSRNEIEDLNLTVETLKANNILLERNQGEAESGSDWCELNFGVSGLEEQKQHLKNTNWFIMQAFTNPVFEEKTLFFELIQRFQTISGFGAGNIGASWRAAQKDWCDK